MQSTFNQTLDKYEDIVRINMKVTNPTLLKSGTLGVITNYIANLKFDTYQYYTKIFKEMNIGLAEDFKSLLFHSTIYDTEIELAKPATFGVSFIIPEINLSEIKYLKYIIPKNKEFTSREGIPFIIEDEIIIEISQNNIIAYTWSEINGKQELTVINTQNPNSPGTTVNLINYNNVRQYQRTFYKFIVPKYDVGETFNFSVTIQDYKMFKKLNAWYNPDPKNNPIKLFELQNQNSEDIMSLFELKDFDIKYYNYGSSRYDLDLFLDIQPTSLRLTTGNGINGMLLQPDSEIIIESQLTLGEQGNLPNMEFLVEDIIIQEFNLDNKIQSYTGNINGLSIAGGTGGQNIQDVKDIRRNIFDKISTRNSIITENDYEKSFAYNGVEPFVDAKFIDAKSYIFLFNVLKSQDIIIDTTSINIQEYIIANDPFYPKYDYNGKELISPFYFKRVNTNETEGYIVNPDVILTLTSPAGTPKETSIEYLVSLSIQYDFSARKTYITIKDGAKSGTTYNFKSSVFNCTLDFGNNYKYEVNTRYTDTYCIIRDILRDVRLDVYNEDGAFITTYYAFGEWTQLIKKQTFFKYYKHIPELEGVDVYTSDDAYSYLDNALADILNDINELVAATKDQGDVPYLLRVPFIDIEFFNRTDWLEFYRLIDNFFMVDSLYPRISYNTRVAQAFYNTIDIPEVYQPLIFKQTSMGVMDKPKMNVELGIVIDEQNLLLSKFNSIFDFEIEVKLDIVNYLKDYEGFKVEFFETELETFLYGKYNSIIRNIELKSPKMFKINSADEIFALINENLDLDHMLNFVPNYFSYDYNSIHIDITT